jgi:hypothetical protein
MAQNFTQADVNQILNQPGIFKFRKYGTSDSYREAIFTNGASFSYTPTVNTQAFDSTGDVYDYIGEEAGEVTFSYGKPMDLDFMSELSNGLFTKTTTAGGDESFVNQVIAGGTWSDITPVTINLIDSTGKYNVASEAPDIASVTASTAGVLAANTDYALIKDPKQPIWVFNHPYHCWTCWCNDCRRCNNRLQRFWCCCANHYDWWWCK